MKGYELSPEERRPPRNLGITSAERGVSNAGRAATPGVRPVQRFTWKTAAGSCMPSRWLRMSRPRTTKLYDRTKDEITIGEVERIQL
jgi:hypothetical protein